MKKILTSIVTVAAVCTVAIVLSQPNGLGDETRRNAVRLESSQAIESSRDANTPIQSARVAELRAKGPAGLAQILSEYEASHDPKLLPQIDAVAAQKDAAISGLYWYTDLEKAKAASASSSKPILYLRLLGKLTDEYSCANSRYFRTVLYADPTVSKCLANNYILVWESERPVPIITIDYGDGRQLKRTIAGNSIHYILNSEGRVIDAMPGLYSPTAFMTILQTGYGQRRSSRQKDPVIFQKVQLDRLTRAWKDVMPAAALAAGVPPLRKNVNPEPAAVAPFAMEMTVAKSDGERKILAAITPEFREQMAKAAKDADLATWEKIAPLYPTKLSPESISMIKPRMLESEGTTEHLDQTVSNFERSISIDTARNEFQLRREILTWLIEKPMDVETLNTRVYAELFGTPRSDSWLGLLPEDTYTGLYGRGVVAQGK